MLENKNAKQIWQYPWLFTESILVVTGVYLMGMALQLTIGSFKFSNLAWPINIILGVVTLCIVFLSSLKKRSYFFQWIAGVPFTVSIIGALVIQTVIMGFTPQVTESVVVSRTVVDIVGFTKMTSAWPFVLTIYFTMIALSAAIFNRLKNPKWVDYAFYLNHVGLFLFLFAAGYGASDIKRYVMFVEENAEMPEWRVYSENKDVLELPIAIKLNDFTLDEYEPKLAIIDRQSGEAIPEKTPDYFQIDKRIMQGKIANYSVSVDTFLMEAVRNSDSSYKEVPMPGSCPAALVTIEDKKTGFKKTGWVCCGNYAQLYMPITINEKYSLVMTRPEAKRFASDIEVISSTGEKTTAIIEVNKPLKNGSWTIYQYGYDNDAGKASNYSSFELVYDPWLNAVYVGISLFAIGCLSLFWIGSTKRKVEKL